MNKTAVVILNYNGQKYLTDFLPSVINHSSDADIYVADNASTDDSLTILKRDFPSVKIILLTMYADFQMQKEAKKIGVHGYILKNTSKTPTHPHKVLIHETGQNERRTKNRTI